jgi:HAD superfamily hydrolase (TIGR01484 family)
MRTLEPVAAPAAVLSFDFDGTLHDPAEDPPVPPEVFGLLRELRGSHGVVWGVNTGRSMPQIMDGFIESRFPFLPDWVVAREHEIYFPNAFGRWLPDASWNKSAHKEIERLFKRSRKLLKRIRAEIAEHTGAQWMEIAHEPAGMVARTNEEMDWITLRVAELIGGESDLGWQRNSIYMRFGHRRYQKGSSLTEIARRYGLGAAACFAIGDSHNDFEMLHPDHAGMAACPSNAVDEIKEVIRVNGGYLAESAHGAGVVEALRHYFR